MAENTTILEDFFLLLRTRMMHSTPLHMMNKNESEMLTHFLVNFNEKWGFWLRSDSPTIFIK